MTMNFKKLFAAILLAAFAASAATAAELKLEAQLIWATGDAQSPNPKHKPAEADVQKKLASLPIKWTHFFEESRKDFTVAADAAHVDLSDRCAVEVKAAGEKLEISLLGKGKVIWRGTQALPPGEILVLGGNAPGDSAWLVALKRAN